MFAIFTDRRASRLPLTCMLNSKRPGGHLSPPPLARRQPVPKIVALDRAQLGKQAQTFGSEDEVTERCPICLDELSARDVSSYARLDPCCHAYHFSCIQTWLRYCPHSWKCCRWLEVCRWLYNCYIDSACCHRVRMSAQGQARVDVPIMQGNRYAYFAPYCIRHRVQPALHHFCFGGSQPYREYMIFITPRPYVYGLFRFESLAVPAPPAVPLASRDVSRAAYANRFAHFPVTGFGAGTDPPSPSLAPSPRPQRHYYHQGALEAATSSSVAEVPPADSVRPFYTQLGVLHSLKKTTSTQTTSSLKLSMTTEYIILTLIYCAHILPVSSSCHSACRGPAHRHGAHLGAKQPAARGQHLVGATNRMPRRCGLASPRVFAAHRVRGRHPGRRRRLHGQGHVGAERAPTSALYTQARYRTFTRCPGSEKHACF